jgi:hypothetical protein
MPGLCTPYAAEMISIRPPPTLTQSGYPTPTPTPTPSPSLSRARARARARALATVQAAAAACIELVLGAWPDTALRRVSAPVRRDALLD